MGFKTLIQNVLDARIIESVAKNIRLKAEEKLFAAMNTKKLEGSTSKKIDGFKVTVTSKLSRKLDYEKYKALGLSIGFVELKPVINVKALRVAERINTFAVAQCVTTKPGKPGIKIEEI